MSTIATAVESQLFTKLQQAGVPGHLHGGLVRYLVYRVSPGDFVTAVLSNDLREAVRLGNEASLAALFDMVRFLWNHAPANAWGSPAKVQAWLEEK